MPAPARAAFLYFAIIFACGFVLGTVRTLMLAPALGHLPAVALELPVMLALGWIVAGRLTRGRALLAGARARLAMGGIALLLLLAAEFTLATLGFGQAPAAFLAALVTPAGGLGLAGQLLFGLMPWALWAAGKG